MITAYEASINFLIMLKFTRGENQKLSWAKFFKTKIGTGVHTWFPAKYFSEPEMRNRIRMVYPENMSEGCHAALKRLQVEYLDFLFCHRPDEQTPIEETVWTMHNLIQQGKFYTGELPNGMHRNHGSSSGSPQHHLIAPVMEQPQYNMFTREKMEKEFPPVHTPWIRNNNLSPSGFRHSFRQIPGWISGFNAIGSGRFGVVKGSLVS